MFGTCKFGHNHLVHKKTYVEVVDDQENILEDGVLGYSCISKARQGTTILRFLNLDLGKLHPPSFCPCGYESDVFEHFGRATEVVDFGIRKLTLGEIQDAVYSLSFVPMLWQVRLYDDKVKIVYQPHYGQSHPDLQGSIRSELEPLLSVPFVLEQDEILPAEQILAKPAYAKYSYIKDQRTQNRI